MNFLNSRYRLYFFTLLLYIIFSFIIRVSFVILENEHISISIFNLFMMFGFGLLYDISSGIYALIPLAILLLLIPNFIYRRKMTIFMVFVFIYFIIFALCFGVVAEHIFWEEFGVRFNFIAVDYLVYTCEVVGNIKESYPVDTILMTISIVSLAIVYLLKDIIKKSIILADVSIKKRIKLTVLLSIIAPIFIFFTIDSSYVKLENRYEKNIAYNGLYQLFSAFIKNRLDYKEFYQTKTDKEVLKNFRTLKIKNGAIFTNDNIKDITHTFKTAGKEHHKNVVFIVVESLSASFLKEFGNKDNITPNLDKLSKQSLIFTNIFATGTRTVRGMEAIALSLPPTPGRSIVKRPNNENIFSAGDVFKSKGYKTSFIYGGYGYFDNMNYFFSHNGFDDIIDRADFNKDEITFANIWGVCDEDLFNKSIKKFDAYHKNRDKFFSFIMTTSNHRPYTYPDNKIDIPSHTGRNGAVKYTDFAIAQFIKKAKTKPWFSDTIFVIIADHCASSAGENDIPLNKYKIPMIIYAPKFIKPQKITKLSSQIDAIPTILGLLNWKYKSKFYGNNILSSSYKQRALLGTYQKLGLYRDNTLTILSPIKEIKSYKIDSINSTNYTNTKVNSNDKEDIITYYQSADFFYRNRKNIAK